MSNLVTPLHIANVGRGTLRFFVSPRRGADLPFHAHDDLLICLGLNRETRRVCKTKLVNEWRGDVKTIATHTGLVTIAPHYVAQGFIGALVHGGFATRSTEDEYVAAGSEALKKLTAEWSSDEILAFVAEAVKRNDGGRA